MAREEGGFGVPYINTFWKSLRLSWFRRMINSRATWCKLHAYEVSPYVFNPVSSNHDSLEKAKSKCQNPFWKEMYSTLVTCRLNVLLESPQEYRYVPINGEPQITHNNISIKQDWATNRTLNDIIDRSGRFKRIEDITNIRKPLEFEYREIRRTLTDFTSIYSGGRLGANSAKLGTNSDCVSNFNIYGRLITKRKRGCSYYYSLLNANAKKDGWVRCGLKLEDDFF